MIHKPVLLKEVIEYLNPKPGENFIDCTVGEAGHTLAILEKNGPSGKVLGIDWDAKQIENSKALTANFKDRVILVNDSYANLKKIVDENNFNLVNGILLDLGMSSFQLEGSEKGFSFKKDQLLDMRYDDANNDLTAEKIVNEWGREEMEKILEDFGEEKFARQIAKNIVEARKTKRIKTTFQLVEIIEKSIPRRRLQGIHCATRTFQALRIAVNGELDNVTKVLPEAFSILSSGGRLVVISFHSLEDRIVKNFFKNPPAGGAKILTKSPVTAQDGEMDENPRSRSAKLRAIIKL
jgi:16S rRNA (cytosine1402-N4)-methyltransferase